MIPAPDKFHFLYKNNATISHPSNMEEILARLSMIEQRLSNLETNFSPAKLELIRNETSTEIIRTEVSHMGKALARQIRTQVNTDVVDFLNKEVAPKVNSALEYVAIQTENAEESISGYRDQVQASYEQRSDHSGLLEHSGSVAGTGSVYISPWVSINYR